MIYYASPSVAYPWVVGLIVALLGFGAAAQDETNPDTGASTVQNQSDNKEQYYQERSAYGPIQRRMFQMKHEFSVGWVYLPLDAYYKGYGVQIAYTIHFSQLVALELFRFGFSYNIDSGLKTRLLNNIPGVQPEDFLSVVFFENTNLVLNLLYGKHSFLNRWVLHYELFVTGGGAFLYRNPLNVDMMGDRDYKQYGHYDLGLNAGLGFRIWIDPTWSVRVDLRDTIILLDISKAGDGPVKTYVPLKQSVMVGLMMSINL